MDLSAEIDKSQRHVWDTTNDLKDAEEHLERMRAAMKDFKEEYGHLINIEDTDN